MVGARTRDLTTAWRRLRRGRGSSILAVIALSMGIGFPALVFAIVHGVLRPLPFPGGARWVSLTWGDPARGMTDLRVGGAELERWEQLQGSFDLLAPYEPRTMRLWDGSGAPQRVAGALVSPEMFAAFGMRAALGRTLAAADVEAGAEPAVLLGDRSWRAQFGSDPTIVGRSIRVDGQLRSVVGVMPPGFAFPKREHLWLPLSREQAAAADGLRVLGRLAGGSSLASAAADMSRIAAVTAPQRPAEERGWRVVVEGYTDHAVGNELRPVLIPMLLAVLLVTVLAAANVASLQTAATIRQHRELAIRTALGAQTSSLLREQLWEASLLAGAGAMLGLAWLSAGLWLFDARRPDDTAFWMSMRLDGTVLLAVAGLTVLSAISAGLVPGLRAGRIGRSTLARSLTRSLRDGRLGRALLALQLAACAGLLGVSGALVRHVVRLQAADLGFDSSRVWSAALELPDTSYPDRASVRGFFDRLEERLRDPAVSGGSSVVLANALPGTSTGGSDLWMEAGGMSPGGEPRVLRAEVRFVSPGWTRVFGQTMQAGRWIETADRDGRERVAVVNESFARRFPSQDALDARVAFQGAAGDEAVWWRVVGVVADGPRLDAESPPDAVYLPFAQVGLSYARLAVGPVDDLAGVTAAVRAAVAQLDPELPLGSVDSLAHELSAARALPLTLAGMFALFGVGALFLATLGHFGAQQALTRARRRELGVRVAMGARPSQLARAVLVQTLGRQLVGALVGSGIALALTFGLSRFLLGVEPGDPLLVGGIVATLCASGLLAGAGPALGAARCPPSELLADPDT